MRPPTLRAHMRIDGVFLGVLAGIIAIDFAFDVGVLFDDEDLTRRAHAYYQVGAGVAVLLCGRAGWIPRCMY